ncbi:uncharacterized protein N7496_000624 [Penicillium cataractarum]|uniref:Uncharacterized protein n=1 Tax=Penicillium cataractarum TaxID=2100454 RepID=A0A9X0B668_9EURO|nr:uncharacterized protein N7496_000624 [Penicillium cataractarum]KAJ5389556.1 hypothetical protein N7496_000624 [Penicillium cataractarum]
MGDSNTSLSTDSSRDSKDEGVLASVKHQLDSVTGGAAIAEIQQNIPTVAEEKVNALKETVINDVVPATGEALQSAQESIRALAEKVMTGHEAQGGKEMDPSHPDYQIIDQMDDEKICDFLRDKHRSTAPPPSKN